MCVNYNPEAMKDVFKPLPREIPTMTRQQVWLTAWTSVASANDCKKPSVARDWADECLTAFDRMFPGTPNS